MKTLNELFSEEGIYPRHDVAKYYTTCPKCSAGRKAQNRKKPVLKVQVDGRGLRAGCCHCDFHTARFYDEGEIPGQRNSGRNLGNSYRDHATSRDGHTGAIGAARGASAIPAGRIAGHGAPDWDRLTRPGDSVRNASQRRVVIPKIQGTAEAVLDRTRGRKVVPVEHRLLPGLSVNGRNAHPH